MYEPLDHYWIVAGDASRAFSSASGAYVAASDARYLAWQDAGNVPSAIVDEATLWDLLNVQAPQAVPEASRPVPTISKAQCLLWLLQQGKSESDIDALIAGIPDAEQRAVAEIEWKYRQPFHHDHPLFASLAPAIGISVDDLPAAFRAAALL
jgi:hypothetical protein